MSIFAASLKASAAQTIDRSLEADFIVQPGASFGASAGFSPEVRRRIAARPEIAAASPLRFGDWRSEGTTSFLSAVDPATFEAVGNLELARGSLDALGAEDVLVFKDTAADLGLDIGDTLAMEFAAVGQRDQTVAGIFGNNSIVASDYVLSMEGFERNFELDQDSMVLAKAAPGTSAPVAEVAVEDATRGFPSVQVSDQAAFKEQQASTG